MLDPKSRSDTLFRGADTHGNVLRRRGWVMHPESGEGVTRVGGQERSGSCDIGLGDIFQIKF